MGEGILDGIRKMGYVTASLVGQAHPSFYKLKDGAILRVMDNVNHLVPDPKTPGNYSISSNNIVSTYVPKENRHPEKFKQIEPSDLKSGITDDDMEPQVLSEEFTMYALSSGSTLGIKSVVSQVRKTMFYNADGDPLYLVTSSPLTKVLSGGSPGSGA